MRSKVLDSCRCGDGLGMGYSVFAHLRKWPAYLVLWPHDWGPLTLSSPSQAIFVDSGGRNAKPCGAERTGLVRKAVVGIEARGWPQNL